MYHYIDLVLNRVKSIVWVPIPHKNNSKSNFYTYWSYNLGIGVLVGINKLNRKSFLSEDINMMELVSNFMSGVLNVLLIKEQNELNGIAIFKFF